MSTDSGAKQPPEGAGYGYNYGGNYAGYSAIGYGDGGEGGGQMHRTFQDYLLILRERIWYIVVVFLVVFSSSLVYTLSETKIYQSSATVQILRRDTSPMKGVESSVEEIRTAEDLNTQIKIIESTLMIGRVASRLTGEDLRLFLAPYEKATTDAAFVTELITKNRKIIPQRLTLVVTIAYQHPDRFVAAKVANLFVQEYLNHNQMLRSQLQAKAVDDFQQTVDEQRKKVDQLAQKLQDYKEQNKTVSLDQRKDIVSDSLKTINVEVQRAQIQLQTAEIRLSQVKEHRAKGMDLLGLPFVAGDKGVTELTQQMATQKIAIAKLSERVRDKHPDMIAAKNTYNQMQREWTAAIDSVCNQV